MFNNGENLYIRSHLGVRELILVGVSWCSIFVCFVIVVGVFSLKSFNRRGGRASKLSHDFRAAEESKRKKAWCNCFSFLVVNVSHS